MARRRLRLFDYQQILEELRSGTGARAIAEKGLASRNKVRAVKDAATVKGWLAPGASMPTAEEILGLFPAPPVPIRVSGVEPYREKVEAFARSGHSPQQIFRALKRETPPFTGSVGAVKRFLAHLDMHAPKAFVVLSFEPGEAAQVDFGSGPELTHPETGTIWGGGPRELPNRSAVQGPGKNRTSGSYRSDLSVDHIGRSMRLEHPETLQQLATLTAQ